MRHPIQLALPLAAVAGLVAALIPLPAAAEWDHSIFVTPSGPEATTWCGPATAQMAMTGYPGETDCTVPQTDIWADVVAHRVEASWDTDPAAMRWVLEDCGGHWPVISRDTREELMFLVARWMGQFNYPVPIVVGTAATAEHDHDEHWVLITGIRTDVDPTPYPPPATVNLIGVWLLDPGATVAIDPVILYKNALQWESFLQPVTKPASAYAGKFVAVIEPPQVLGRALIPGDLVLSGPVIPLERALAAARQAIERHRLAENEAFRALAEGQPLTPLLVNREQGGYYLIPYSEQGRQPATAVLINAYTGELLEAGTFQPARFLTAEEARELALRHLGREKPGKVAVEAVYLNEAGQRGMYSPTWKVKVDDQVVGVTQTGTVLPRITDEIYALAVRSKRLAGIAGTRDRLWTTDASTGEVLEVLPASGAVLRRFPLDLGRPKGLAFDGSRLWVADEQAMRIQAFDPDTGQPGRSIALEVPREKGYGSLEALAWDGRYLWTAIAAGYSSSLNQIDPQTGQIVRSLFADCDPRGLASDGERLWTLCYNGRNHPATVDERLLAPEDREVVKSRRFFKKTEGGIPSGLAFDGEFLWYTDAQSNRAVRFVTPGRRGSNDSSDE